MSLSILRKELLSVIHGFHAQGWAPATSANYSFRNPAPAENTYTISRSGLDKGTFRVDDFMQIDQDGRPLEPFQQWKPSAETLLHTMVYAQPNVNAVLHTHSVQNTVYSWNHRSESAVSITGFELLKGIAGITSHEAVLWLPIFKNSQDIPALSTQIKETMVDYPRVPGFLLAGHGLYAWGSSIAEAKRHVEVFEFLFECLNLIERK